MKIDFYKYHGAGNDFVMIDNRNGTFKKDKEIIQKLCHRNFGIGADGLIILENDTDQDFKMIYYNADGNESTMCGNGGRCIVGFAHQLGIFKEKTSFNAIDGLHHASLKDNIVSLQMMDVDTINVLDNYCYLNTGSPHHVEIVQSISDFDVYTKGKQIRNEIYGTEGSNINFVEQINQNSFRIRTYERGVENETLACGTGATAVAIAMYHTNKTTSNPIHITVEGGELSVSFENKNNRYTNVFLTGEYELVFSGSLII